MFASDLEAGTQNASIVRAVASMGRSLQMRVVAEGVETAGQARMLRELLCDELQGYHIAKPMPATEVEDFLARYAAPDTEMTEGAAAGIRRIAG